MTAVEAEQQEIEQPVTLNFYRATGIAEAELHNWFQESASKQQMHHVRVILTRHNNRYSFRDEFARTHWQPEFIQIWQQGMRAHWSAASRTPGRVASSEPSAGLTYSMIGARHRT